MKEILNPLYLRPNQVVARYGIGRSALYRLFDEGLPSVALKGRRPGKDGIRRGTRLVKVSDLEAYIEAHVERAAP